MLLAELADERARLSALARVQPLGGLVEDHDVRLVQDGLGNANALTEALGELANEAVRDLGEVELLHRQPDLCGPLARRYPAQLGDEIQVVVDPQVLVQRHRLRQVANVPAGLQRIAADVEARDRSGAGGRRQVPRQDPHGGCLAGPVGPQEAKDFAAVDGETHVADGSPASVILGQ